MEGVNVACEEKRGVPVEDRCKDAHKNDARTWERGYDLDRKVQDVKFRRDLVKEMDGEDFNFRFIQKEGFDIPVLVESKDGLHIQVPEPDFSIGDVRGGVGSTRLVNVVDTKTDRNEVMTMKQFHKLWKSEEHRPQKVLSMEISNTKLENFVKPPLIVRQMDWVERAWPRHLKLMQTASNNAALDTFPKVQKYVSLFTKGTLLEFSVNEGGSSSWIHVLSGRLIAFLAPPTRENLLKYAAWKCSANRRDVFLGDLVDECGGVAVEAEETLFLPCGWIYAVYAPENTMIFRGQFLHSFNVGKQLEIAVLEEAIKVPDICRYPFLTEMLWYVLERYVHVLTGRSYVCGNDEAQCRTGNPVNEDGGKMREEADENQTPRRHVTKVELNGLKAILLYLNRLPPAKKICPQLITDPAALIRDVYHVVTDHQNDDLELAITGKPLLIWHDEFGSYRDLANAKRSRGDQSKKLVDKATEPREEVPDPVKKVEKAPVRPVTSHVKLNRNFKRHKRQRCKVCEGCKAVDCLSCVYCRDRLKYGGPGRLKKSCVDRQCSHVMLPARLACDVCLQRKCEEYANDPSGGLFECVSCGGVAHESCSASQFPGVTSRIVNKENWEWLCHECAAGANDAGGVQVSKKIPKFVMKATRSNVIRRPLTRGRPRGSRLRTRATRRVIVRGRNLREASTGEPCPPEEVGRRRSESSDGTSSEDAVPQGPKRVNPLRNFRVRGRRSGGQTRQLALDIKRRAMIRSHSSHRHHGTPTGGADIHRMAGAGDRLNPEEIDGAVAPLEQAGGDEAVDPQKPSTAAEVVGKEKSTESDVVSVPL